jgi:hypothetical protein
MNELAAFILGLAFKAILAASIGNMFNRFADHAMEDIKDWPKVLHYLEEHEGKSFGCLECKLGKIVRVDSISEDSP